MPPHVRDFEVTKRRTEIIDGDMTPADILGVLEELKFDYPSTLRAVRLDRDIRDYIVAALRRHTTTC